MIGPRVLVVVPNDFRAGPRARFAEAQWADARAFCKVLTELGAEVHLLEKDLVEPRSAYLAVKETVEEFMPERVIERCYLWADPPNGHAVTLATPDGVPLGVSAYIAPDIEGVPLGEAPGEVFQLHTTCANWMVGRDSERLFGPLEGPGSDQTRDDLKEFLNKGQVVSGKDFRDYSLPIGEKHTEQALKVLMSIRGEIVAMTGNHCMGMPPCHINFPWHGSPSLKGGWGLNIPIIPPDLFDWVRRFEERRDYYMDLGRAYVQAMVARDFRFLYQRDYDGSPMPSNERDYTPEVAAFQMALYAVMLDMTEEMNISILGIPAQLLMTRYLICGDLIKGVANSSWGPEGRKESPLFWMTEGDIDGGISHRVLNAVTGQAPGFADVRCYIPSLEAWKMCNSGSCCADLAEGDWSGCFSTRQYSGYFESEGGGGTFAFWQPKICNVVGLRVAIDQDGVYGTVAIGRTVWSKDRRDIVDGRWPQLNVEVFDNPRKARYYWPTNHFHWAESGRPLEDACVLYEVVRLAAGDKKRRVQLLYDGRKIPGGVSIQR